MAGLVLQDDTGTVVGANAYLDLPGFKAYHDARNQSYVDPLTTVAFTDDQISGAIVRSTDYMDKRFNYIGWRRYSNQPTAWPRWDAVDINDRFLKGIPIGVQQACAEYALRALTLPQMVTDPARDPTGRAIRSSTTKVGPIETQTYYENSSFEMPRYPAADRILTSWGLILRGGTIQRA